MAKRKRRRSKKLGAVSPGFRKYIDTMKMSKGRSCNRKAMLRAVKRGASPSQAVSEHCR